MSALLLEILASWARIGTGLLTAYLISHGILTPEQGDRLIVEVLKLVAVYGPALGGLAWGAWSTYAKRRKLLTAAEMHGYVTEDAVERRIENGLGAKVI